MALRKFYATKDEIPEGLSDYYTEADDGTWRIDVEGGFKADEDVSKSMTALQRERQEHRETKKKLKRWEGLGAFDEIATNLDRLPELEAIAEDKGDINERVEQLAQKRLAREVNPLKRQIEALSTENAEYKQQIESYTVKEKTRTVSDKVRSALAAAKARDTAIDDALMYANSHFELTEDGAVITRAGIDGIEPGLPPEVWTKEMQRKKPHWWPDLSGGGSTGAGGTTGSISDNPFAEKTRNVTAAAKMAAENPKEAARLAKAAGESLAKWGLSE